MSVNIEKLKLLGSEWQKNGYHRIYFNELTELFGLSCRYYNTGNISSATLDGERITNCRAAEIASALANSKLWFDMEDQKFHSKMYGCRTYTAEVMRDEIIAEINRRCAEMEEV